MQARFTYSLKLSLAIVLAYGFALWFNWDRPMWAAFAVALVSMPTLQQSLVKGGLRLSGTLAALFVALSLIALFPQQRWPFMLAQAGWLAFCTLRMTASGNAYFWFCAAFVSAIITANGGPYPVDAFSIAVIRALETALGIACFALVFGLANPLEKTSATPPASQAPPPAPPPQALRYNMAAQVFVAYCVGFLLVIFVPGFPGGYGFLGMLAPFAIILATSPKVTAPSLVLPVALSILFAAPIYFFLMPLLDGFAQLAPVIFLTCFAICWFLHRPEQALARTLGLAFFAVVTGIANEQAYSFMGLATTVLMFGMVLLVMYACSSLELVVARNEDKPQPHTGSA